MVFKINRLRLRNYSFVFTTVLAIFLLVLATPAVFKFDEYFGIGYYRTGKDYRADYSDGYGEMNVDMRLEKFAIDSYSYLLLAHLTSGSDVEIVGIKIFNYTVVVKGSTISTNVLYWDPPRLQFAFGSSVLLKKDDSITWNGYAEIQFISNNIVQNETFDFILRITIPMSYEDYYNMDLIEYVILFLWIMAFLVVPLTLKFIFQPQFGVDLDDETKKKQKMYYDFFKKSQEE